MTLTRSEFHVLRRLDAGKTPGSPLIAGFLERKGLVACEPDGRVVATPAGSSAFAADARRTFREAR